MRKIFLDNLPHKYGIGANKDKLVVNWKSSVGYEIKFIYDNIKGEIKILNYYIKNKQLYLQIEYNFNIYDIHISSLKECRLANVLNLINHKYTYQIGDILKTNTGELCILKQIRIKDNKDWNRKGYKYKCLVCGYVGNILEQTLKRNNGCPICGCNKTVKGINDMYKTNPSLASLLANPEDGYRHSQNSNYKVDWKCPYCSYIIKNKRISTVNKYGLSCPKCGDGISYPEKIMFNVLEQLNIDFIYQLTKTNKEWCKTYRYDFYFKINNEEYIIETHGIQHYSNITSFKSCNGRNLQEEQENDKFKKGLAIKNGIKSENYIVIDCRKSELEWIKNNILKSKLNNIFDLSKINWLKCHKYACSSLVRQICDLWNSGIRSTKEISEMTKISRSVVIKYLKQGNELKWCNYNPKYNMSQTYKKAIKKTSKKVICLNNKQIFVSLSQATHRTGINNIYKCCKGKTTYSGKDPITKEKLHWMYYDEYIEKYNNQINNANENIYKNIN